MIRLRPIVYTTNYFVRGSQNTTQQMLLLKALQVTQDPQKLREMIHVRTVADVFRTLDKMAMRKEYHAALNRLGISFDFIATGIRDIATGAEKDDTRLKAYQTLLKSVGMEKYDTDASSAGGSWEEVLLKKIEDDKKAVGALAAPAGPIVYEVKQPVIPASAQKVQDEEAEMTSSIYESNKGSATK